MAFSKYRAGCPQAYQDDMRQHILIALAHWCHQYDGRMVFGAYVWPKLVSTALEFIHGRRRFGRAALKNAERHELPGDEPVRVTDEGEEITRGQLAEDKLAKKVVERSSVSDDRHNGVLHDIRLALEELDTLDKRERKVLRLRYLEGLGLDRIAPKLKLSHPTVKRICRSAIGKLRAHFKNIGALSPDAPLPHEAVAGDTVHWHYR